MFDNVSTEDWKRLFWNQPIDIPIGTVTAKPVQIIDSRGEGDEGGTGEVAVIFEVNNKFYRKSGYVDSWDDYNGWRWDSDVKEVKKVTKTVEVWE